MTLRVLHYEPASEFLRWSAGATPKSWEPWFQWKHGGWARRALVWRDKPVFTRRCEPVQTRGQLAFDFEAMR